MQMDTQHLIPQDYFQYSGMEDLWGPENGHYSSPFSSPQSFSISSPEYPSLPLSSTNSSSTIRDASIERLAQPTTAAAPPNKMPVWANNWHHDAQFPTPTSEDIAIANAMIAVISSASSTSSAASSSEQIYSAGSGFRPYGSTFVPKLEQNTNFSGGQKMLKKSMSILKEVDLMKEEATIQEPQPRGNQLHHLISERRRREKLNESFHALRQLLPPGSKKDKAAVLCKTTEYLQTLKAQIFDLEEKNQVLEMHLNSDEFEDVGSSVERVKVEVIRVSELMTGVQRIELKVTVRVECDLIELVLYVLECLKAMGAISLVSMDANTSTQKMNQLTWATIKFDIKASHWDEIPFKQAVIGAVDLATLTPGMVSEDTPIYSL